MARSTSRSRSASKANHESNQPARRRGGRKPGEWRLVTAEQIKAYREQHRISRARLAQTLGVSSTSVQNWETGTVATMRIQERLAALIAAGPVAVPPLRHAPSLWDAGTSSEATPAITATGAIVAQYVQTRRGELPVDDLVSLIRNVRQALM